jgi:capsular polysaccharide biosynthesis protein
LHGTPFRLFVVQLIVGIYVKERKRRKPYSKVEPVDSRWILAAIVTALLLSLGIMYVNKLL